MKILRTVGFVIVLAAAAAPGIAAQQPVGEGDATRGRDAGRAAASSFSGGWFAKGLLGGLIGGPIGTGVAFTMAGRDDVELPPARAAEIDGRSPLYSKAFHEAYEEQRKMKRKESAFVGGMLGTAVWTWAILRAADLIGGAEFEGDPGKPPPSGA